MCLLALGVVLLAGVTVRGTQARAAHPSTTWRLFHFRGPDGRPAVLVVGLPRWYGPERNPRLPLVISPHGRGGNAIVNMSHWGDLPGRARFIVLDPDIEGRVLPDRAWAYPAEISELADLPQTVHRILPWLRWDPQRVYAIGSSMGGQEALMMVAHRPDEFAAVVASDAPTDFLRRWYEFPRSKRSKYQQREATREVGSTPSQAPWLYRRRSPITFARTIAFSGVAVQLWWSRRDEVVINQATTQTGRFFRRLRVLNPTAPIAAVVHDARHNVAFHYNRSLPAMIHFLFAHRRQPPPAEGFSYTSWLRAVSVWGWRIRSGDVGPRFWRLDRVRETGFESASPAWLLVRPPFGFDEVRLDGQPVRSWGDELVVPAGRHVIRFVPTGSAAE